MYDQIEGVQAAEAERRQAALAQRSHVAGHWDRMQQKFAAIRSSIENFTPEVRPGNQSELGTRASPFAAYITAMHRQIHKLFTLGFLSDIDARNDSLYADDTLWTQLEIVVKGDGTIERVGIVHGSGVLPVRRGGDRQRHVGGAVPAATVGDQERQRQGLPRLAVPPRRARLRHLRRRPAHPDHGRREHRARHVGDGRAGQGDARRRRARAAPPAVARATSGSPSAARGRAGCSASRRRARAATATSRRRSRRRPRSWCRR